ncbi:hypothetical protein BpHYR1_044028 [Brachionus plicatilis]|uniref:Uncharacterized protein n=1 Tax=Brachionus plicatilis TaxID=10195 RepID=A0A3M7SIB4_BRAPC|nr:hypothetical protein BpHYR1_044028 [Brachionus plicatilis]
MPNLVHFLYTVLYITQSCLTVLIKSLIHVWTFKSISDLISKNLYTLGLSNAIDLPYIIYQLIIFVFELWYGVKNQDKKN